MTGLAVKYTTGCVGNNTVFVTGRRSMAEAMTSVGLTGAGRKMSNLKGKTVSVSNLLPMPTITLDRPVSLGSNICTISSTGSALSMDIPSTSYMSNYMGIGIKMKRPSTTVGAGAITEFKFRASNYFTSNNYMHLAVITRGVANENTLEGKGLIIGNVSGYPAHSGVCKPTILQNDIGIESFWTGGNCVYGSVPNPQSLKNGVIYSVKILVNDVNKSITFRIRGSDGYDRTQTVIDQFYLNSSQSIQKALEFAIGGVLDTTGRRWTMQIGDMAYYNVK